MKQTFIDSAFDPKDFRSEKFFGSWLIHTVNFKEKSIFAQYSPPVTGENIDKTLRKMVFNER